MRHLRGHGGYVMPPLPLITEKIRKKPFFFAGVTIDKIGYIA